MNKTRYKYCAAAILTATVLAIVILFYGTFHTDGSYDVKFADAYQGSLTNVLYGEVDSVKLEKKDNPIDFNFNFKTANLIEGEEYLVSVYVFYDDGNSKNIAENLKCIEGCEPYSFTITADKESEEYNLSVPLEYKKNKGGCFVIFSEIE